MLHLTFVKVLSTFLCVTIRSTCKNPAGPVKWDTHMIHYNLFQFKSLFIIIRFLLWLFRIFFNVYSLNFIPTCKKKASAETLHIILIFGLPDSFTDLYSYESYLMSLLPKMIYLSFLSTLTTFIHMRFQQLKVKPKVTLISHLWSTDLISWGQFVNIYCTDVSNALGFIH